jgi:hypothetical protein
MDSTPFALCAAGTAHGSAPENCHVQIQCTPRPRRVQGSPSAWPRAHQQPPRREARPRERRRDPRTLSAGTHRPAASARSPDQLFNAQHTALEKPSRTRRGRNAPTSCGASSATSGKGRLQDRADPRNLGDRTSGPWSRSGSGKRLAPATIQTYLSFLRGLALWLGKPGFIRKPAHYGLTPDEYQRHENAQRDRSWTAAGIDIDALIERVSAMTATSARRCA